MHPKAKIYFAIIACFAFAIAVIAAGLLFGQSSSVSKSTIGRYQVVQSIREGQPTFLLDTQTGQTWFWALLNEGGASWVPARWRTN
jgi:hypothetical protein